MPLHVPDAALRDSRRCRFPQSRGGTAPGLQIGYKLAAEAFDPQELIRQAVAADAAGFDFVEISDHYHPWLDVQGHSP